MIEGILTAANPTFDSVSIFPATVALLEGLSANAAVRALGVTIVDGRLAERLARGTNVRGLAPGVSSTSKPCGWEVLLRMPPVASTDERTVATRDDGVAREADRTDAVRAVAVEARDARGRATLPTPAVPAEATGADARGVGSAVLVRPVSETRGLGSVLFAAVGVFMLGDEPMDVGVDAVLVRPGVVDPRAGSGGIGCAWMMADAARESRRRAGPETGGRVVVNVLLRLLRMGVLASTGVSMLDEVADRVAVEAKPLEALPERGSIVSCLTVAIPEARGLISLDVAVGVTRDGRGAIRDTGFVTAAEAAEGRVTVDDPVRLTTPALPGVLSTICLPS